MGGISVDGGGRGGRKSLDAEINMIPMIDLLMVTISFLLITAVWTNMSRVEASTHAPSNTPDPPPSAPAPALHVLAADTTRFKLEWREGEKVLSSVEIPRANGTSGYTELAKAVGAEWQGHGVHRAASDLQSDRAVIHTANDASYREFIAILDAVSQEQRDVVALGKSRKMQVFAPVLSAN